MMLNEQDQQWVKAIAKEVSAEIIKEVISEHIESCPHGKKIFGGKNLLIGICIGAAAIGGVRELFSLAKILIGM